MEVWGQLKMDNAMLHIAKNEILSFEKQYRTNLINSISGFRSPVLIGTTDKNGITNLAIFNSFIHIGAHPPLFGFISRPNTVERHTLENILATGMYTINHVSIDFYEKAHQTAARYPKEISEFEFTHLKEQYLDDFMAPYVRQSSIKLGLHFKEKIDIQLNQTHLIIGEIQHIYSPPACIEKDGTVNLELASAVVSAGLETYYSTKKMARLSYAKPTATLENT